MITHTRLLNYVLCLFAERLLAVLRQQKQRKALQKSSGVPAELKDARKIEDGAPVKPSLETPRKEPRSVKAIEPATRSKEPDRNGREKPRELHASETREDTAAGIEELPLPENEIRAPLRSPHIAVSGGKVTIDYGSYQRPDMVGMMPTNASQMAQRDATPYVELSDAAASNYNPNLGYSYEIPENNVQEHTALSYGKVFGMSAYEYAFDFVPPTYRRHRRHSDSDSESVRNFMSSNMPIHGILELEEKKPTPLQPMKWISKKARKKSEDQRRKAFPVR